MPTTSKSRTTTKKQPPALVQRECFGRIGHFAVEETPLPRSVTSWNLFVEAARDRDAVLSYEVQYDARTTN
jgi:hypothetical protein